MGSILFLSVLVLIEVSMPQGTKSARSCRGANGLKELCTPAPWPAGMPAGVGVAAALAAGVAAAGAGVFAGIEAVFWGAAALAGAPKGELS